MTLLSKVRDALSPALAGQRAASRYLTHPHAPLISLPGGDCWRLQDSFEGVQVFGGTGSGKSSSSGKALASAFLRGGFGGLVLCAKPDESERWRHYLRANGRLGDLVWLRADGQLGFNFLEYEMMRPDGAGQETFNLVNLLLTVMEAADRQRSAGGDDNPFWRKAQRELLANAVTPLFAATGTLRLDALMRFVTTAPRSAEEATSAEWKERSYCYGILRQAYEDPRGRVLPEHELRVVTDYWFITFAELDGKTRSNLLATLTSTISPFLSGRLREVFCTATHLIPEMTHEGAVIVVDFPVKVWGDLGIVAASILKYQWQRATERRRADPHSRPVFLWADECQFFVSDYDMEFQSTARSSRACTVYITQNLPSYYSQLKGRDPRANADALLGNFQTKIFHANADNTTNQYASELIGKQAQRRQSANWSANKGSQFSENISSNWSIQRGTNWGRSSGVSSSFGSSTDGRGNTSSSSSFGTNSGRNSGGSRSRSRGGGESYGNSVSYGEAETGGWSEQMDYVLQPAVFARALRKGGPAEGGLVDAVIVQAGRRFRLTGAHWTPCIFTQ